MAKKSPPRALGLSAQDIRNVMRTEFDHYLNDIEWRVAQAYDVSRRPANAAQLGLSDKEIEQYSQHTPVLAQGKVYAEDLDIRQHQITGYTTTAQSPAAGQMSWSNVHIVYGGTDYQITDGNAATTDYYLWFQLASATGTAPNKTAAMQKSLVSAKPTLVLGDCILFLNNAGVPVPVLESPVPKVIGDNSVDTNALQGTAVTAAKIANQTITSTQISNTAGITGTQLSGTAGITGTQLSASANISGTQISPTANLVGTQLTAGTLTNTQLAVGAVTATRLSILDHIIY